MRSFKNIVLMLFISIMFSSVSAEKKTLLVVGEEFAPFEFMQNGKVVGIDIDIARHIFNKMGIPVEFQILPWKRAWSMVENGEADAVLTTSRKEKREPFVWYPEEDMWVSEFVFFTNKAAKKDGFKGYETAKNEKMTIGIISGNSYHSSFWEAFPYTDGSKEFKGDMSGAALNPQLKAAIDLNMNLKKLAGQRIDLIPADKTFGSYTAKLLGLSDKVTYYDVPLYSKGYPMPFVKKSKYPNIKSIADQFEKELKAMKANGEYQKIFDKWLK